MHDSHSDKFYYQLPIAVQQEVKSYAIYALPLCVVYSETKFYPWVLKNFLLPISTLKPSDSGDYMSYHIREHDKHRFPGFVDYSDVLISERIEYSDIDEIIPFVEEKLKDGYYLHCGMDDFYVPAKRSYKKTHDLRPSLIYGYNEKAEKLYAAGFIDVFREFAISFTDFEAATKKTNVKNEAENSLSHKGLGVFAYKPKIITFDYHFRLSDFIELLDQYLNKSPVGSWVFGVGVYNIIFECLSNPHKQNLYIKYNTIHFLAEHKIIFKNAIGYILKINSLESYLNALAMQYDNVVKLFERIRLLHMELALKDESWPYISTKDSADKLYVNIKEAVTLEKAVVSQLYAALQQCI